MNSLVLGLDLGGTKVLGIAMAEDGSVVGECRQPTPRGEPALMEALDAVARELRDTTRHTGEVVAVGVGAPGLVDRDGVLRAAPNLPGVERLSLRAELEARLGLPVRADNDATCAAWGERQLGAARGKDHAI